MKKNKIYKLKLSNKVKKEYSAIIKHFEWDESDYGDSSVETPFIEWMFYRKDWKHFIYKNWELILYNT